MTAEVAPLHGERPDDEVPTLNEQLRAALRSRDVIGMAKGIIMVTEQVGPDEAFTRLARLSTTTNRKVRDVAADLVERHSPP